MIPGLIIIVLLLWAWMPIACLVWCVRRAGRAGRDRDELVLEGGHVPHPGFEAPPPYAEAPAPHRDRERQRRKGRHDAAGSAARRGGDDGRRRDDRQQSVKHAERSAHYSQQQAEREGRRRDREARDTDRARGWFLEKSKESLLLRPEHLAARESGRQRRLMDESRGYPSQV